jgi:GMP synthase-like glutamine amidotransferase
MSTVENIDEAINESDAIRKIAIEEKKKRMEAGEEKGEPTKEDYENADKSLTRELAGFIRDGSQEFEEISKGIEKKFKSRMEGTANLERLPKRLLILECTNLDDLLGRLIVLSDERLDSTNLDMLDVANKADQLPSSFDEISGIIITGSPSDIAEKEQKPWIGIMEKFIKKALERNIPVLGICFGIQAHADLKGREVPKNKGGREMGVWETDIYLSESEAEHPIFKGIDFKEEANGQKILKSASAETLGSHAYCVEYNPKKQAESMHGFHFTEEGNYYPMVEVDGSFVGLQFHPEMSIPEGISILKSLVKKRSDKLIADGKDPKEILKGLEEYQAGLDEKAVPDNVKFLRNFVGIALENGNK